jgi:hypothetical protein
MPNTPRSLPASEQRQARLEARLSLYAQYAALLGAEMSSAWSADPAQAGAMTRRLARARAELAEQYDELRGLPNDGTPLAPEAFGGMFAEAVLEMDQQRALDQALRAKAETLRPDASGVRLLPAPVGDGLAVESAFEVLDAPAEPVENEVPEDGLAGFGGALVAARSSGVGGVLGGQFPGVVAGVGTISEEAPVIEGARLDVRF